MRLNTLMLRAMMGIVAGGLTCSVALARTMTPTPTLTNEPVRPVVVPYAASQGASAAVAGAFSRAKVSGRPVLLIFGGNWSPDCWAVSGVLALPSVSAWVAQNFEVALVNVARRNENMDISRQYGAEVEAVPAVLVLSADGKLLNGGAVLALSHARQMTSQAIVDLLAAWGSKG
ncbi:thioredoxin family protein [Acetobacter conturbans]|uniref:Thiol reductase thioredoxin n=1 Tax=Acetobacter conturbans TaxID=1737472 RepID=A0ABX0JYC3_9PROT|nr:thioredoxin family protein [Acetobacter conturbans]NHN87882.1 thiol reductase thioredoxin [Acetobacter conturbans]